MKTSNRFLLVLVVACGCSDATELDSGTDASVADGGADATLADVSSDSPLVDAGPPQASLYYFRGIYFVPERSEVSSYPVAEVKWIRDGDRASLGYNLPRLLVGQSERVAMTGTVSSDGRSAELSGPLGTAACDLDVEGLPTSCLETFTMIEVDLDRVRREAEDDDPANVEARVAVASRFQSDPIGVIEPTGGILGPVLVDHCTSAADCGGARCDLEPMGGICEPEVATLERGAACMANFECLDDMECDEETRTCQPHGGD